MTNPTTHLPVQEPAGAVEAKIDEIRDLVSSLGDYRIMEERGHASAAQVKEAQDEFETALSALASLQPVTQAWRSICDSEWVNIVNAPIVQEQGSDSHAAVCEAFKLIEAKLRELNEFRSAAPQEAVERQPLTGWQPIETAPKDGKAIYVIVADAKVPEAGVAHWSNGTWRGDSAQEWEGASDPIGHFGVYPSPTHWQPLPEPPGIGPATQEKQHG